MYERLRATQGEMDIPFDDVYHKEKSLVDNVIRAELALKRAAEEDTEHPYEGQMVPVSELLEDEYAPYDSELEEGGPAERSLL